MKHNTQQREAILKCLKSARGPLSPREILEAAGREVPGLGVATVYRNLKLLVREGLATEIVLPGQGSRYEISGLAHHHHFQCRDCRMVFCLEGCSKGIDSLAPAGFILEEHDIVLYGRCAECSHG